MCSEYTYYDKFLNPLLYCINCINSSIADLLVRFYSTFLLFLFPECGNSTRRALSTSRKPPTGSSANCLTNGPKRKSTWHATLHNCLALAEFPNVQGSTLILVNTSTLTVRLQKYDTWSTIMLANCRCQHCVFVLAFATSVRVLYCLL